MTLAWLPNAITLLRMALAVPLAWLILAGDYHLALVVALFAGGSDAVDGWLAKRFGWDSWLGGVIDPMADKLMLVAAFTALTLRDASPTWLFVLVLARDLVIVAGAVAYHNLVGRLDARPTLLSKFTTLLQILYVLALLVHLSMAPAWPPLLVPALGWLVAAVTLASGLDYIVRWGARARAAVREARLKPRA
ncbi:MAG TPA: CDP-alcohol phosphatidyltransferase family protein [Candidatus Saccharimonadia bacterium]|nr:CDP-alcohol phosphatidyltransferase family protein [Candidatus Saccharimonadia bacterium]